MIDLKFLFFNFGKVFGEFFEKVSLNLSLFFKFFCCWVCKFVDFIIVIFKLCELVGFILLLSCCLFLFIVLLLFFWFILILIEMGGFDILFSCSCFLVFSVVMELIFLCGISGWVLEWVGIGLFEMFIDVFEIWFGLLRWKFFFFYSYISFFFK